MTKEKPRYAINIRYLRNQVRLTREEAAIAAGISVSSWSSYEEGRAFPNHARLPKMCEVLDFYDVLAIITKDLANDRRMEQVEMLEVKQALRKMEQYLEQQKTK